MKGISFTEPLFHAVVEGRKTQTRRIISERILDKWWDYDDWASSVGRSGCGAIRRYMNEHQYFNGSTDGELPNNLHLARYKVGETVFLQEPYQYVGGEYARIKYKYDNDAEMNVIVGKLWENKLFMPAKYARYFIEITSVRAERLQNISDEDCEKEGIIDTGFIYLYQLLSRNNIGYPTPQEAYAALINKINGKGTWDKNPYVWVYDFKLKK